MASALLIDVMNTVLITTLERYRLYQTLLEQQGIRADRDHIREAFIEARLRAERPMLTMGLPSETERQRWTTINSSVVQSLAGTEIEKRAREVGEWLYDQLMGNPSLYQLAEGMYSLLSAAHGMGYRVIAASNQETPLLHRLLAAFGVNTYFDDLAISDEVGFAKPDPRYFAAALARAQTTPRHCVFMGNNPLNDIEGARSAGVTHCILMDYNDEFPDAEAYVRVRQPLDAVSVLERWRTGST